jgi:hypothetical protein
MELPSVENRVKGVFFAVSCAKAYIQEGISKLYINDGILLAVEFYIIKKS